MKEVTFLELIRNICRKPAMYTGGSVKETLAFIDGYRFGKATPISDRIFDSYVCIRNSFPSNYVWTYVIDTCATDKNDAMRMIEEIIVEFVELRDKLTDEELLQHARAQLSEESEAEKMFKQFDAALIQGDELQIKSFIEEHPGAHILWEGVYPEDIANQLYEMSSSQLVRSIPVSDDGKKVKIIASGWPFPIEMNFKDGKWRINAEKIIELKRKNK